MEIRGKHIPDGEPQEGNMQFTSKEQGHSGSSGRLHEEGNTGRGAVRRSPEK